MSRDSSDLQRMRKTLYDVKLRLVCSALTRCKQEVEAEPPFMACVCMFVVRSLQVTMKGQVEDEVVMMFLVDYGM